MSKRSLPTREGFTLIELLIVIVIIGILATLAVSVFWSAKDRGLEATLQSDLRTLAANQESYFDQNLTYAADVVSLSDFASSPSIVIDITYADTDGWSAVASSPSLDSRICGIFFGAAPAGGAGPATTSGRVECGAP